MVVVADLVLLFTCMFWIYFFVGIIFCRLVGTEESRGTGWWGGVVVLVGGSSICVACHGVIGSDVAKVVVEFVLFICSVGSTFFVWAAQDWLIGIG